MALQPLTVCTSQVGSPRHVPKALNAGVDIICAQGYEAGGHTGEVATMVLIPQVVKLCKGKTSPLSGGPVHVVAAGGMYSGATLAAALALGAEAVWVGTRFLASDEATATKMHKETIVAAKCEDTVRSVIFTGRPARFYKNPYVRDWEENRQADIAALTSKGKIPYAVDLDEATREGWTKLQNKFSMTKDAQGISFSQSCGDIDSIKPAGVLVREMISEAVQCLQGGANRVRFTSRL